MNSDWPNTDSRHSMHSDQAINYTNTRHNHYNINISLINVYIKQRVIQKCHLELGGAFYWSDIRISQKKYELIMQSWLAYNQMQIQMLVFDFGNRKLYTCYTIVPCIFSYTYFFVYRHCRPVNAFFSMEQEFGGNQTNDQYVRMCPSHSMIGLKEGKRRERYWTRWAGRDQMSDVRSGCHPPRRDWLESTKIQ